MDRLHHMLRAMTAQKAEPRKDHLSVFREFLAHLEKASRSSAREKPALRGRTQRKG